MISQVVASALEPPSRLLLDLAAGRLDEPELEALAVWLAAEAVEPPSPLIERAVGLARHACVTI